MKNNIKNGYSIAECIYVISIIVIFIVVSIISYQYSFYPRYQVIKTKNYDCFWAQDAYSCMKIKENEDDRRFIK